MRNHSSLSLMASFIFLNNAKEQKSIIQIVAIKEQMVYPASNILEMHCDCLATIKPVRDTLDVINGKWKLPIIISIGVGNDRFTDIQESIPGITPKVLAKELKDLEQHKLILRTVIDEYPVKVSYQLEPYADTLTPIIYALKDWGVNHRKVVTAK